jgi:hypothetical protein
MDHAADPPGIDHCAEFRGEADHIDDAFHRPIANGGVRVREIQVVRRENLSARDARDLEPGSPQPLLNSTYIHLGRMTQGELNAIETEIGTTIDAADKVVPHRDERARQRIGGGNGQTDLHRRAPRVARGSLKISFIEISFFIVGVDCRRSGPECQYLCGQIYEVIPISLLFIFNRLQNIMLTLLEPCHRIGQRDELGKNDRMLARKSALA